jgi:hypothetical protein
VGRPSWHLWLNAAKAELGQFKLIDKDIDRLPRPTAIQPLRKYLWLSWQLPGARSLLGWISFSYKQSDDEGNAD